MSDGKRKVYREIDGVMHLSEWPEGSLLLSVGSRHSDDCTRWDDLPIEMVNYERRVYARMAPSGVIGQYGPERPFPERWHEIDAYAWRPLKEDG